LAQYLTDLTSGIAMQILIVDDEQFFASNLCALLEQHTGVECHAVCDAQSALKAMHNSLYDLIICDIRLGEERGDELIPKLNSIHPGIPFIIVSAYEYPESLGTNKKLNILKFYEKPFDARKFCEDVIKQFSIHNDGGMR